MKQITKIDTVKPSQIRKERVAAYCRVSTGTDEQLVSLETQKSHYEQYIQTHANWEFVGLYYDEGISGTKKEIRPALMRMMKDCEEGKIDRVLTKSLSRFSRNTADCLELVRRLLELGIPIRFEKENLDTGEMENELLLSIMSSLAESESVSISKNSKWGVRHRFMNDSFRISYPPYGFKTVDGVLEINGEEAAWVRYIFAQTLAGKGTGQIAKELNDMGVPTRRTGHWTASTIRSILTNEKMVGDCLFQKTYTDSRFRRHINHGEADQFFAEGHHDAIIGREDFEAAARVLEQRGAEKNISAGTGKYQNRYAFSGKIICGECGAPFTRRHRYSAYKNYILWTCSKHLNDVHACSMKSVREDDLQIAFVTMMNKLVFARGRMLRPFRDALRGGNTKENLLRIDELEQRIEKNTERQRNLVSIMSKGYLEPALFNRESIVLKTEAEEMRAEKETLIKSINGGLRKTEEIDKLLRYVNKGQMLSEYSDESFRQFVEKVVVDSPTEVTFVLRCGLMLKERLG